MDNFQNRSVRCFLMGAPKLLEDLLLFKLYKEANISLDELALELFTVLRFRKIIFKNLKHFLNILSQHHQASGFDESIVKITEEVCSLIEYIMNELIRHNLYNEHGRLQFNTLWFENPDTFVFYVMMKEDIDEP